MLLVRNISSLLGVSMTPRKALRSADLANPYELRDAWLLIDDDKGVVAEFGKGPEPAFEGTVVDAGGGIVLPSFCDSHTHIVYAGSRDGEFLDKIKGLSYEQIAANGGGILNSADLLAVTSEDELYCQALARLNEVIAKGTGAIEIKSGYGLSLESELKMLRVIARLRESTPAIVRSTFLGAHAVGRAYTGRQAEYVDMLVNDMLPAVAAEGLADFVDVFCDRGFFTVEETDRILEAASRYGLRPKIHANELDNSGGVQVGIKHGALSVDHLERAGEAEVDALAQSDTVATCLPGASFFLSMPYAPARAMVDAGVAVALASDYNPGSSPSGDMKMVVSLGCIKMKLLPAEAINAATVNGAAAMGVADICGTLAPGMKANFMITHPIPSLAFLPYAYTSPTIAAVYLAGHKVS